jgi:hypothetical protein
MSKGEKFVFWNKKGLFQDVETDGIGKDQENRRDYSGPRGPSGLWQIFNSYKLVHIQKEPRGHAGLDRS